MREHARIARFFAPLSTAEPGSFNLTDDAAVLAPPTGKKLVVTTDSVIRGVHVPATAKPEAMARKLMRRNLSDLAAMGATPWRYLLNLHTSPTTEDDWFAAFAEALKQEQQKFGLVLVGGDMTSGKGPLSATMTCLGLVDGEPLLRKGAKAGDALYVSGTIGDAALGLQVVQRTLELPKVERLWFIERYFTPEPRLALGQSLRGLASSVIDCSDGLLADAAHLAQVNNLKIMIEREAIPLSPATAVLVKQEPKHWDTIASGGDDYELIFTIPWSARERVARLSATLGLNLTRIGSVTNGRGLSLVDAKGQELPVDRKGWEY